MESGIASHEGELDAAGLEADAAVGLQRGEGALEGRVAETAGVAQLAAGQRLGSVAEHREDPLGR